MDFLLSFRSYEVSKVIKQPEPFRLKEVRAKGATFNKFLMLSVDNEIWTFLQLQGICLRYLITTYVLGFHNSEVGLTGADCVNIVLDVFYLVDLISAILYRWKWPKSSRNLKETSPYLSRLVWHNLLFRPRSIWMLVIDVISLIPFEVVRLWVPYYSGIHAAAHCAPTLRTYRIPVYYVNQFKRVSLRVHTLLGLFVQTGIFWALLTHTFTCLWIWLAKVNTEFSLQQFTLTIKFDHSKPFNWYLLVYYFVQIGFTNIGFGDIVPSTDAERAMTIIILLVGFSLLCGYLIAALSSVLTEKGRRLTHMQFRLSLMLFELESKSIPESVSKKIIKFYYSLWASRKGIGPLDELLLCLPDSFKSQVYYDIFTPALNAALLFKSCDEYSKRAITGVMKICLYMAGDVILKRREFNSRMFYIRKGTIQIMSYQDDETEVMTFGAGTVFGQISLMLCLPTKSEVHAATFCEIHTISKYDLFMVLKYYPDAKEIIFSVHKNMLLNVMADKYYKKQQEEPPGNVLTTSSFYKIPIETSKLARDDICIVTTCPYVYMPDTIFLKTWNVFIGVIVTIISFYYPYQAAFRRIYATEMEPFIIIVDIIFVFNLYLTFSTAFVKENIIFSSLRDIIAFRLTNLYVCVDIAAIMPIHYFMNNDNRLKSVLLCFRCLLFYKVHLLFRSVEYTSDLTTVFLLRLLKYVLYFLFGAYAMGIIYYMQACFSDPCGSTSWYVKFSNITEVVAPIWVSVYFATLVMTGTGFGDITIGNTNDIAYVLIFGVLGVLLFIYLIADYSANISLTREPRQKFVELADRVNSFLLSQKMLSSERTRVRQFLNLQWERSKGYDFTCNQGLFFDTPQHLLYEASQYTLSRGIQKMKLFRGMENAVIGSVLNSSFRQVFPPHEVVIYAGELCNYLMVIEEGFCEVTYGKDVSITKILRAGQDICTVELILGLTAMCHVRTLTHCVIMKVSRANLKRALALNPIAARELEDSVLEFKNSAILKTVKQNRPILLHLTVRSTVEKSLYRFRYYRKQSGNTELREPYLKLGLCQWIRFLLRSTTVLPYGKFLKRWEFSRCVFAFLSAILFPCLPYFQLQFPALYYVGIFLDVVAWIDLYFRCHVCYYNSKNLLVSHPLWTCGHYLKGSLILDFMFSFPFDRVMYRPVYDGKGEALVTSHPIDLLRIFRVGQIYRIPARLTTSGVDFLSTPHLFWVIFTMAAMTMVFINLLTSILVLMCTNYKKTRSGKYRIVYESSVREHFKNLLSKFQLFPCLITLSYCLFTVHFSTKPLDVFILNFYWTATTAFGVGFGDITASTQSLMVYVIIVIVISYLYFNYVTVIIASNLTSINMNLTIFQKRMGHLVSYLNAENVEPLLRKHIVNHFEYIWKKNRGMKAQYVFHNFNSALRDDVMFHLYEETVKGVFAFSSMDPSFHRLLSSRLDEIYFQSGAAIYKPGDVISQCFIVHQGEVTLVGKNEDETKELGRSKIFGHFENVGHGSMTLTAVATKNVTVLGIDAIELYQILEHVERGLVDQIDIEKDKLTKALYMSNDKKAELDEDTVASPKAKNEIAHLIHRFSKLIILFYGILSLYSANIATYNLAFQFTNDIMLVSTIVTEFFFFAKIILGFFTGYVDEFGEFVSDLRLIKGRYLRTIRFYVDIITSIPFEVFSYLVKTKDQHYIWTWLRMVKLLRLYNVWYFFNLRFDTLSVNMVLLKITAVAVWTSTLLHQFSCIWFLISCPKADCPDSETWIIMRNGNFKYDYLSCLYFIVIVLTTTGFGDITPHTMPEIIFVITLVFLSFFYIALFIGEMVSTSHKYLFSKTNFEFKVEGLKNYLHVNDVPYETRKTIMTYVKNLWRNERGLQIPELLRRAPRYLTYEIKLSTYGNHINEHHVFRKCSPDFRKHLISLLLRTVFYPRDIIVYQGQVNGTTYFVHSGHVESQDHVNTVLPKKIYMENTCFGLPQCIKTHLPHSRTYYAIAPCVILSLNITKRDYLRRIFPDDMKLVTDEVEDFLIQEEETTRLLIQPILKNA